MSYLYGTEHMQSQAEEALYNATKSSGHVKEELTLQSIAFSMLLIADTLQNIEKTLAEKHDSG
jgi:hypothetical protein